MYRETLIRHWDPENRYGDAVLKVYAYWVLEVSWRQHTLGCYIIFCRHEGVRLPSELAVDEAVELLTVMRDIEDALRKSTLFQPEHFNYLQMGNALPHLHFHGIPRYQANRALSRTSFGCEVIDANPGNPPSWTREEITPEQMYRLHEEMRVAMGGRRINMATRENPFHRGLRRAIE